MNNPLMNADYVKWPTQKIRFIKSTNTKSRVPNELKSEVNENEEKATSKCWIAKQKKSYELKTTIM